MLHAGSTFIEGSADPMWVIAKDGYRILDVNAAALQLHGYDRAEVLAMTWLDLHSPIEAPRLREAMKLAQEDLREMGYWRLRRKDGHESDVDIRFQNAQLDRTPVWIVTARSLSHILTLESFRNNLIAQARGVRQAAMPEAKGVPALFAASPGKFMLLNPDGLTIASVCSEFCRTTGMDARDVIGRRLFDLLPRDPSRYDAGHASVMRASLDRVLQSGRTDLISAAPFDVDGSSADASTDQQRFQITVSTPVRDNAGKILQIIHRTDDVTGVIAEMESGAAIPADFSDRQTALATLDIIELVRLHNEDSAKVRRSEAMLNEAQRLGQIGSWTTDLIGEAVVWSDQIFTLLGHEGKAGVMTFTGFCASVHPDDLAAFLVARNRALLGDGALDMVHRIVKPDGEVRVMRHLGTRRPALREGADFAGTMQDITTLHTAALQATEALSLLNIAGRVARMGAWRYALSTDTITFTDVVAAILDLEQTSFTVEQAHQFNAPAYREKVRAAMAACATSGVPFDVEVEIISAKGKMVWVREIGEAEYDASGAIIAVRGAVQDITEIVDARSRAARADSMRLLAGGLVRLGGWSVELQNRVVYWSPEIAAMHGLPDGFVPSFDGGISYFAPEYQAQARRNFENCAASGIPFDTVVQIVTAQGEPVWVRSIGEAQRDHSGVIVAVHGAMQDISELMQARHVAERVSAQLLNTFESIREALMTVDRNWRFVLANSECVRLLAHDEASLVGKSIWAVFPETIGSTFWNNCHLAMAKGTTLRFVECFKPVDKWFDISIFPSTEGLSIFFHDVTDRLAQEKQLRLLETAVARLNDVLIITDAPSATEAVNCRIVYVNAAFTHVTGYSRDVAIGGSPRMLQGPQTQRDQLARIREAIQRQKAVQVELINYTRTGAAYWVEMDITPLRDEAGQLTHYVAIQRDISERKAADVEARLQNERFRLAAEATTDVIWDWNIAKGESWWSGAMNAAYQHDSANKGPNRDIWLDNLHPEDRDRVIVGLMRVVEGTEARWKDEYRFMRGENGGVASVMDRGFVIRDASGTAVRMIGSMTDMSIQRDLEDRLRQSTRLQAVGELTGGIAHDFNNLLTVILGNAELLSDKLKDDPTLRAVADMTASAAERGASLTSRLLAFASKQSLAPVRTDVNPLIRGMDGLLRRTLSASISLQLNLDEGLGTVLIDHGQLENALLNLVINGRDAMPDGGLLRVATSLVWADPARSDSLPEKGDEDTGPKAYIVVSVADSGTGMSRDVADRAFDPFFTTKGLDKGSGLGLSMVYGFARQSGGHAEIRSVEGQGTTVSLFLPRADLDRVAPQTQATAVEPVHGTSHILLVEDDPLVLEYASSQLESLGYRVTTAINGRSALALLAQLHDVDLLLTDIVMPGGLTGYDLARMAAEVRPDLKVLFTSGYSEHASDSLPGQRSTAALLSKPYRRAELALRVKVALDSKP